MSRTAPLGLKLPLAHSWIHALLDLPAQPRRALLLIPPFFHEWPRSYRLFALLAEALRALDVAVLRFDYRGCGDSGGADSDFLPSRALADAELALATLKQRSGLDPIALGVRGGGLIASELRQHRGCPLWLWQPVVDGQQHLAELEAREAFELNWRMRFPYLGRARTARPDVLMGQCLHPEFKLELGLLPTPRGAELELLPESSAGVTSATPMPLPAVLSDWTRQLDFSGRFTLPPIRALAQQLAEWTGPA